MDNPEEIHLILADGRVVYWPKGDMARLAPAAVCHVASAILRLRKILKDHGGEIPSDVLRKLEAVAGPISFEKQFLSGNSAEVHNAKRN